MQTQAPRGQYRVLGLDPFDTLTWPSGPLCRDCKTLDEARDLADRNGELYLWVCVYDDAGEVLYETGCYQEHLQKMKELDQEPARRAKTERFS
ncbi:MAG: hypothetical protein DMG41_00715 [Acidobacteria bacterium]|nr:MAG: hypothetical protein DMG41_00715 [Acidobacteriota bacterium]